MKSLVVKELNTDERRREVLRWQEDRCDLTWEDLLLKVEEEFSLNRQSFRLSLNHGKTVIESSYTTRLSELGIVNGDLLALVKVADGHMVDTQSVTSRSSMETNQLNLKDMADKDSDLSHPVAHIPTEVNRGPIDAADSGVVNQSLSLPILLRDVVDDNLPQSFHQLMESNSDSSPVDQLVLATHTLLLESGFIFTNQSSESLLTQCRSSAVYKMAYSHVCHQNSKVTIACVSIGSHFIIHGVVSPAGNLSLTLTVKQFLNKDGLVNANLVQLSNYVKDKLIAPLILVMKEALNMEALPPILDIPNELSMYIIRKLDYKSVCQLGSTCKHLSRVYRDNMLWRRLYLFRYGNIDNTCNITQECYWYQRFKERSMFRRHVIVNELETFSPYPFHNPFIQPVHHLPPPIRDDPANRGLPSPYVSPSISKDSNILGFKLPRRNLPNLRNF